VLAGVEDEQQFTLAEEAEQPVHLGSLVGLGVEQLGDGEPRREGGHEQPGILHR
jgi:hypothetical protein